MFSGPGCSSWDKPGNCEILIQTWKLKKQIQFNSFGYSLWIGCSEKSKENFRETKMI